MRILVTNDDGYQAPGLKLLAECASQFGETTVVAPADEQSGISHRVSFERPIRLTKVESGWFHVDGTPADCVRAAISELGPFDLTLAGVNDGGNLGIDVFYSGTVAAARESAFFGVPAIALSQHRRGMHGEFEWNSCRNQVLSIIERFSRGSELRSPGTLINVNLPDRSHLKSADEDAESLIVVCDVDSNPLPPEFELVDGRLHSRMSYSNRPRVKGCDTDICMSGSISVSYLRW